MELMKVWELVNELSEQLANNRALVAQLKSRAENVKGQAVHVGAGFPLRRFNLDISDEDFHTELEAFASHLVLENQTLQHEHKQLNALLKEYEGTLETVMGKFRGVAHSSQQHDLALHSYYTQLLHALQTAHSSAQLHDDTTLSTLLTRLSTLLRAALRSVNGEGEITIEDLLAISPPRSPSPRSPRSPIDQPTQQRSSSTSPSRPTAPGLQRVQSSSAFGFHQGASGGYFGTEGQSDWSMERETEIQRLQEENRVLREMLGITQEADAEEAKAAHKEDEEEEGSPIAPKRRMSSLTAEDLEADSEKERLKELEGTTELSEVKEEKEIDADLLGFRASAIEARPDNVFDETDGEVAEGPTASV